MWQSRLGSQKGDQAPPRRREGGAIAVMLQPLNAWKKVDIRQAQPPPSSSSSAGPRFDIHAPRSDTRLSISPRETRLFNEIGMKEGCCLRLGPPCGCDKQPQNMLNLGNSRQWISLTKI